MGNYTIDFTEKTAKDAKIAKIYQRKIPINPRNPRLFSVDSPITQSPKEMPKSRAVRTVSLSRGTVFMRRVACSRGT